MTRGQSRHLKLTGMLLLLFSLGLRIVAQSSTSAPAIHGVVRDFEQHSLADVLIELRLANGSTLTTKSDQTGAYSFGSLSTGTYSLRAKKNSYADADSGQLALTQSSTKTLDLTLKKIAPTSSNSQPEFFDEPQFTVAGVTDTTALGGHGSDVVVHTRNLLAHDTASLSKNAADRNTTSTGASEQALRQAIAKSPNEAELHHQLADVEEKSGNSLEAVHEYQRAAELAPSERNLFDWGAELLLHLQKRLNPSPLDPSP